jgi:hypothetical protein
VANQQWVSLLNPGLAPSGPGAVFTMAASTTAALSPQTSVANQDFALVQAGGQPYGWYPGMLIRVTARMLLTTSTTTGTLTFSLRANKNNATAPASNTVLATAVGITTGSTAVTGIQCKLEAIIRCTAVASSGNTVSTQGELTLFNNLAAVPANPVALNASPPPGFSLPLPNISGETAAAVDTTQPQGLQLCATSTAASGSVQCTQWLVEALD